MLMPSNRARSSIKTRSP